MVASTFLVSALDKYSERREDSSASLQKAEVLHLGVMFLRCRCILSSNDGKQRFADGIEHAFSQK